MSQPTYGDQKVNYDKLKSGKNICVECKHHLFNREIHLCNNEKNVSIDLITGNLSLVGDCFDMRDINGLCGPDGKLFEQK